MNLGKIENLEQNYSLTKGGGQILEVQNVWDQKKTS